MREPRRSTAYRPPLLLALALSAAIIQPLDLQAQRNRDRWQRVPDILVAMAIGEGSYVADVGAGDGYFVEYLSDEVGSSGRVFAVDISERALSNLRRLVDNDDLDNVDVVRGELDDPNLPSEALDAILVVNAYHEMTEHEAMLAAMLDALKPGGRLVMLDHVPSDDDESRTEQTESHDISIDIAEEELQAAGFEILERHEEFTGNRSQQWMLVARR